MKKLVSIILCLTMLLSMLPAITAFAAEASEKADSTSVVQVPVEIAASDTGAVGVWYNNGSRYDTTTGKANYIEVVSQGCDDTGAIHVYQDNVTNYDMSLGVFLGGQAAGTYTLKVKVKGDLGLLGETCKLYPYGCFELVPNLHNSLGTTNVTDWTEISYEVTVAESFYYLIFSFSKYNWATDFYMDNIQLLNSSGEDVLAGAGNFYEEKTVAANVQPATILDSNPSTNYAWFNHNGYVNNDTKTLEIVEEGADDVGSIHVYQPDGQTADGDMMIGIRIEGAPVGAYTLSYNIKGSDLGNTDNNSNKFYLYKNETLTNQFRVAAGVKSLSDWTTVTESFTTTSDVYYIYLMVSKYVNGADYYVDNVKLLDGQGNDLLCGAGNFCVTVEEPAEPEETDPTEPPEIGETIPDTIYDSDPQELYQWYNGNGYTDTDQMHLKIVPDGADDVGAMHIYQTDGVTGTEDMRLKMHTGYITAGNYTLKMKIKGTDLGNTDMANACRFYVYKNEGVFPQIRNLAGSKSVAEWTEFSQEVVTDSGQFMFCLSVSKYVNGVDVYIDNLQLLDNAGNDVLHGAGDFCTVWEGEAEPVEGLLTLDANARASAYEAPDGVWTPMYPTGAPDSSTWPAWDNTHYGEIVAGGYRDRGALHLKSASYKNTAVAIGVDMKAGETYTLGFWAKGTTNSGRVLAQYGNGDPVVIAASTALTEDWSYYECVFTAGMPQLNLLATDWGNTNIYIDHITLIGSDGVDLLEGCGDFCEEQYRVEDPLYLVNFEDTEEAQLGTVMGQTAVADGSDPTLTLNEGEGESGKAMQAIWSYDGTNPSYLHRYISTQESWAGIFAWEAVNYRYLRMWINNPSHVSVDVSVVLKGEDTVNYFDASASHLIRKDGTEIYGNTNNNSGYGEESCISIPKQFAGWLSIPLRTENLLAAQGYTAVLSDFAKVTEIQLELRKIATTGEGDSEEYYYVLDDICLSCDITGKKQSTDDGNEYADYDTSVKGSSQVQNVIFLIGDGMGYGSLDAARLDRPTLYMDTIAERGGVVGAVATTNLYGAVTDSAAAGTALATGFLTKNSLLGLTDNYEPVMNLGEYMKQLGKKLGLVTTTYVLDATPAAFASHTSTRGNYTSIALDILSLGVDVVQGGGRSYLTASVMDAEGKAQTLTELAQSQYGYSYATTAAQMEAITSGKLWGIYDENNMPYVKDQTAAAPTLEQMSAKAFQLLENESGFFVMIEGGQIDSAGHSNSPIDTRLETLAFDNVVKLAMDYADANPGTLLIITADHETGGVRVAEDGTISYYTTSHTDELVPYYAYGAGAECFENLTVNTQLNYAIRQATIGDVSTISTSVPTDTQLGDTEAMTVTQESGITTYTGAEQIAQIPLMDAESIYAAVKYKTNGSNLVGMLDGAKIYYAGDEMWHISDVLTLNAAQEHIFQPISYIKGDVYNSIDIAGESVQIDWIGFFDSYEGACAFQADAALSGSTPAGVNSISMTLDDNLNLNFYVAANEAALDSTVVTITVGEETVSYGISDGVLDSTTGNYCFTAELAAAQMTDAVGLHLVSGARAEERKSYTVRGYADGILAGNYEESAKELVKEMLHYGAAAQSYFGYNTNQLADAGITGAGEREVPSQAEQEVENLDNSQSLNFYAASLVFHSRIGVRFYFSGDVEGCSFTANGKNLTPVEKNGEYYVEITDILPQDLDEQLTVMATDAQGNTLTVSYGPMNYIVRMNAKGSETLKTLVTALYNYYLAAEAYAA